MNSTEWKYVFLCNGPIQKNAYDCGMFCIHFAEAMSCKQNCFKTTYKQVFENAFLNRWVGPFQFQTGGNGSQQDKTVKTAEKEVGNERNVNDYLQYLIRIFALNMFQQNSTKQQSSKKHQKCIYNIRGNTYFTLLITKQWKKCYIFTI